MATLSEQKYNAVVYDLIDAILTASPSGVQSELQKQGFDFRYGQNAMLAEKYLLQLYQNNRPLFWQILESVPVNSASIPPAQRERLSAIVTTPGQTARAEWLQSAIDFLKGTTTVGESEETTSETSTGAYVAYVVIVLAIIGITVYMLKTVK